MIYLFGNERVKHQNSCEGVKYTFKIQNNQELYIKFCDVDTHLNHLNQVTVMSTHNIGFGRETKGFRIPSLLSF